MLLQYCAMHLIFLIYCPGISMSVDANSRSNEKKCPYQFHAKWTIPIIKIAPTMRSG